MAKSGCPRLTKVTECRAEEQRKKSKQDREKEPASKDADLIVAGTGGQTGVPSRWVQPKDTTRPSQATEPQRERI
jgi:hypothetical protein